MKVSVHIDRLVIEGADLTRAERATLAVAARHELGRLLAAPASEAADSIEAARPGAGGPAPGTGSRVDQVAVAVAAAIHRSLPAWTVAQPRPAAPADRAQPPGAPR